MQEKTNYQKFLEEIEKVKLLDEKPTLLLHACCGPCACYPILLLSRYFKLTVLYNNSNIYPKEEFLKRLEVLKKYIDDINIEKGIDIKLVARNYDNEKFDKLLSKRKEDREGNKRCFICYSIRYKELVELGEEFKSDYVSSVMTISRFKDEKMINKIIDGYALKNNTVKVLNTNFKKNKDAEIGAQIAKERGMYRQKYCGCKYSNDKNVSRETN